MRIPFIIVMTITLLSVILLTLFWSPALWALTLLLLVFFLGIHDMFQVRHSLLRNFPVIGRARKLMESLRPMIQQYFIESDTEGMPVNRVFRSVVYQRAKGEMDTVPYGTKFDVYRVGYEWIAHSLAARNLAEINSDIRITVGGSQCKQP